MSSEDDNGQDKSKGGEGWREEEGGLKKSFYCKIIHLINKMFGNFEKVTRNFLIKSLIVSLLNYHLVRKLPSSSYVLRGFPFLSGWGEKKLFRASVAYRRSNSV